MGRLNDKIAIVTGAGQGIGKAIAGKLDAEGATVVVTDLDEATAQKTATALPGSGRIWPHPPARLPRSSPGRRSPTTPASRRDCAPPGRSRSPRGSASPG